MPARIIKILGNFWASKLNAPALNVTLEVFVISSIGLLSFFEVTNKSSFCKVGIRMLLISFQLIEMFLKPFKDVCLPSI